MKYLIAIFLFMTISFTSFASSKEVKVGVERAQLYFDMLQGKKIAVFSNHTGMVGDKHTLDFLVESGFNVTAIFSPEHGFRGTADAGEHVSNSVDKKTNIPILSLYDGNSKAPSARSMDMFDVLVVDIQDVGLRFYTYYISMYYLMEACAKNGKKVIVLDRPNPNGHYVDGPILDMKYKSGVGVLPIPVVHGMTLGELAMMINGEGWLSGGVKCDLKVVPCENYTHKTMYTLPIAPSPNLPNMKSIYLYPSTCFFEGTPVSLGRGTDFPFLVYGHPDMKGCSFSFTPRSRVGAVSPPLLGEKCYGVSLQNLSDKQIYTVGVDFSYIIDAYNKMGIGDKFFTRFFELLVGVDYVREMIKNGSSADEIKAMWSGDVKIFKVRRKPYLLYKE